MSRCRWSAEFLAGTGGCMCKEEITSEWFQTKEEAKKDADRNAEQEVNEFPFSRGRIMRLILEDEDGKVTELIGLLREQGK